MTRRPRILFLDAYDSFSNNITSLLTTLLDADVSVLPIDSPLLLGHFTSTSTSTSPSSSPSPSPPPRNEVEDSLHARFCAELRRYDALVCGPGPGSPLNDADVGVMKLVWSLAEDDLVPVLGVCLGFQSLVAACGGGIGRLRRGMHGMVREIIHQQGNHEEGEGEGGMGNIFYGVGRFKATLYHSLCGDVGQGEVMSDEAWQEARWRPFGRCPDLLPLAWVEEERDGANNKERILMAVKHRTKPFWGVQYHPESVCTEAEGNKVIVNWFREAQRWNRERGRTPVLEGEGLARAATRPSLLSRWAEAASKEKQWWDVLEADPVLHSVTVQLPRGVQVPDIVEAVEPEAAERIVLDSANAAPATSRPDVRGRYSIVATGLAEALRIEYHTGDSYATVKAGRLGGLPVNLSQQVPLARYGGVWALIAGFHEARRLEVPEPSATPFVGGFMGYITYEQGLSDIGVALNHPRLHHRPDICLAWITKSIVVDHLLGVVHVQHLRSNSSESDTWLEKTANKLLSLQVSGRRASSDFRKETQQFQHTKTRRPSRSIAIQTPLTKEYESKVKLCQEYIAAGESYELCLTDQTTITRPLSDQPLTNDSSSLPQPPRSKQQQQQRRQSSSSSPSSTSIPPSSSSWSLFKRLRTRQPAPFASYLRLGGATLVSASPERFLAYDRSTTGRWRCSMRPMKGTVRKSDSVATLAQAERILHVPKEEAENLMIVDLVRHDLHGVCGPGNVSVPHLLKVEEYQSVFQMVTVVEGQLPRTAYTGLDVLAASLPPGSMTGAPKKRSCEILRQVEGFKERSLYSGVVGYMCATGRGDWSVTIRSLFRWDDEQVAVQGEEGEEKLEVWRIGAGGAVTILSTPDGEREEMFTKLAGPLRVFGEA
ncbi:para-aminobenzoate synthase [Canariomyces notabilis]|uniref:aminodeoxychorismate synthase n=1 Tax=Canariomyces notabilis TaxID=2074819 RepID=A0AAN6TB06_9PEZI|nr:para-aminobenzoate synthase [Canariomyces arenarius]